MPSKYREDSSNVAARNTAKHRTYSSSMIPGRFMNDGSSSERCSNTPRDVAHGFGLGHRLERKLVRAVKHPAWQGEQRSWQRRQCDPASVHGTAHRHTVACVETHPRSASEHIHAPEIGACGILKRRRGRRASLCAGQSHRHTTHTVSDTKLLELPIVVPYPHPDCECIRTERRDAHRTQTRGGTSCNSGCVV